MIRRPLYKNENIMKLRQTIRYFAAALLIAGGTAVAQDADPAAASDPNDPWEGEVALGYLASNGNTDSTSATFEFRVRYTVNAWQHQLAGRSFGSSQDKQTTAENYRLAWKSSYDFTATDYGFGRLDWIKNRFSGYPQQAFVIAGYGRRVLDSEKFVLNLEVGAGYADQQKYLDTVTRETEDENGGVGRLAGDFTWNFSETAKFEQLLAVSAASANTFWESISRVKAQLIGQMALGLSYTIQSNSDVAPGVEKTDTFTAITLDYSF